MSLAAKLVLSPLLVAQAAVTRARLPRLPEPPGEREGVVGRGRALRLLVAGDSSAAGVGVASQQEALAPRLARVVAEQAPARVHWRLRARSGLTTAQTLALLLEETSEDDRRADVAVIVTGVNDVVEQIPSQRARAAREALANRLRNGHGVAHVVFAPLPPIHQFPGLPQPLRWVAGADARRHNAALAEWAATRGDVSCVEMEVPLNRGVMAEDGFHPGEPVYRYCANTIGRHIALAVWPQLNHPPETTA
jgi:lysophospholipase L1-like esterase